MITSYAVPVKNTLRCSHQIPLNLVQSAEEIAKIFVLAIFVSPRCLPPPSGKIPAGTHDPASFETWGQSVNNRVYVHIGRDCMITYNHDVLNIVQSTHRGRLLL